MEWFRKSLLHKCCSITIEKVFLVSHLTFLGWINCLSPSIYFPYDSAIFFLLVPCQIVAESFLYQPYSEWAVSGLLTNRVVARGAERSSPKINHTYPTMMKFGT